MSGFRIGLIGYGAIGRRVHGVLAQHGIEVAAALLRRESPTRAQALGLNVVEDVQGLLAAHPDAVLECGGQAVAEHGPAVLAAGIDLIVASIGALADARLHEALRREAVKSRAHLVLPSGAVGGLDALAAMTLAGPVRVVYRSRKPPMAWTGTPAEELLDLAKVTAPSVFYRGTARRAALDYPKNANVAATIGLVGAGLDETAVELMADPDSGGNVHEIEAEGPTGRIFVRLEGVPDPENPKTSMLTAYSLARAVLARAGVHT
jgi:aspartate dehydrogenase